MQNKTKQNTSKQNVDYAIQPGKRLMCQGTRGKIILGENGAKRVIQ